MLENQKCFIKRHVRKQILQNSDIEEAIQKSYSILGSEQQTKNAIEIFEKTGSISETLHETEVIHLDISLLKAVAEKERLGSNTNNNHNRIITNMLETDQTIDEIFSLLKTKLRLGLAYAFWLSALATLIFTIISRKVIPQFRDMFESFGAELPEFTGMAVMWQDSIFPPSVIGAIFTCSIGLLLFIIKDLSSDMTKHSKIEKLPFIKNIVNYVQCIRWLSQLEAFSSLGYSLKDCQEELPTMPHDFNRHMPNTMEQLKVAEKIQNLPLEFEFQIHYLNQQAEKVITVTTRKLLGVVMLIVVSYISFSIIASYLPVLQLGAII